MPRQNVIRSLISISIFGLGLMRRAHPHVTKARQEDSSAVRQTEAMTIGRFRRPTEQELIARGPVFTLFDFALLIDSPSGQAREGGISGSPSTPASGFPKTIRSGRTRASRRVTQTTCPECDREIPNASSQRGG